MFTIEMLPGGYGDALWIEYGDEQSPNRILIDGGAPGTGDRLKEKIAALPEGQKKIDLVVITHIDLDHISGILELLEDDDFPEDLVIADFWFNDFLRLPESDGVLGPKQGERVSFWLEKRGIAQNIAFAGKAVQVDNDLATLPVVEDELPGGMKLTLLSPTVSRLKRLRGEWEDIIEGIGLEPGDAGADLAGHPREGGDGVLGALNVDELASLPFRKDTSKPNASSIAFLADHNGKRVLFTGDAFADDLEKAIAKYLEDAGETKLRLDAWKLSHHGGKKNTSPELIELIQCPEFLVPTNGARYHHPNEPTLARILKLKESTTEVTFHFNYRSDENEVWDDSDLQSEWNYQTKYPEDGQSGIVVDLS